MLKVAHLYKDKLIPKLYETWYDPDYQYYYDTNPGIPDFPDKPDGYMQFVSVNEEDNVIGYMSYWIYEPARRAMNFGIMCFDKGNPIFLQDCLQMFKDIFEKYRLFSMEWRCYANNKRTLALYRNFIYRYGGVEVGRLRQNGASFERNYEDTIIFEIISTDLCWDFGKIIPKRRGHKKRPEVMPF